MFQSIHSVGNLIKTSAGWLAVTIDPPSIKDKLYHYVYNIVDDSFGSELWTGICDQALNYTIVRAGAVISCYESKQQNVALNLALYHRYLKETYFWYNLEDEIQYNIDHTPYYREYASEVRRYLHRYDNLKVFW
jgi:hypothetical protein